MASSKKDPREAKARIARMEANNELRKHQLKRRKRDDLIAAIAMVAVIAIAVVLQITVFSSNPTAAQTAAVEAGLNSTATESASASASASATATAAQTNSPGIPAASTAKGKTFTGDLTLNGGAMGVQIDGTKAPQAAAVFKSLTAENFFKGLTCFRLTNTTDEYLIQCGSKTNSTASDPSYQWGPVENSPASGDYPAGSIAVARGSSTYSNGTQFFITYKDTKLPQNTGGYTLMGNVTSGLDVLTKIAAQGITKGATDGTPVSKVTIDSFTLN